METNSKLPEGKIVIKEGGIVAAKKFSEVYPKGTSFEAERVETDTVLNKEICVQDIHDLTGPFGDFIVILAIESGKEIQFATGSTPVVQKLKKAKAENNLPLTLKIIKRKSEKTQRTYYDIE